MLLETSNNNKNSPLENKRFNFWSQKITFVQKITFMFTSIFALGLLLTSLFVLINISYFYKAVPVGELDQTLSEIVSFIQAGNEISDDILEEINPNRFVEIIIVNENTNVIISNTPIRRPPPDFNNNNKDSDKLEHHPPPQTPHSPQKQADNQQQYQPAFNSDKINFFHKERSIEYNGEFYKVFVFRRISQEQYYIEVVVKLLIAVNILGLIAAYATAKYLSKRLINPIKTISMAAEKITIEDLSQRIEISGPDDELKDLAITFNAMINRLETSFNKQNQFISDASHELKTPISVIQGYANLINRWGKKDPEVLQESIDSIQIETEHMSKLVKKLLFFAREEQNKKQMQKINISLNQICSDVIKECSVLEIPNQIKLIAHDDVTVYADPALIKQLLWIFIDNSIKYSTNNDDIEIKVQKDDKYAFLSIIDNGIGIDEAEIPFIFDRFYRVDKSRNKEIDGTGLGLSIAKWIIEQHNGEILVNSKLGSGCEMKAVLLLEGGKK